MSRCLMLAGAAAMLSVSGCGFWGPPSTKLPATRPAEAQLSPPATHPVASSPATQPAVNAAVNPAALASQTEAFASTMQAQLERRGSRTPASPATPPPSPTPVVRVPDPVINTTDIRWLDPKPHELTLLPRQDPTPPHPAPKEEPVAAAKPMEPAPARGTVEARADAMIRDAHNNPDQLEGQLAQRLKENPRDVGAAIEYQLLQFLRGRAVPQMDAIASLGSEDRELVAALMDALINFRANARAGDTILLSRKARPLIELADRIRAQSGLTVPTVAVCSTILSFGRYEPMPPQRIVPGREVAVYCEVENFTSRLNDQGMWETRLTQDMVLFNEGGQRVAEEKREPVIDLSRNRRHDFYISRKLRLPAGMPAGKYKLVVSVEDQQAGRANEGRAVVNVVAPDPAPRVRLPLETP